jgi:hypothetical protein
LNIARSQKIFKEDKMERLTRRLDLGLDEYEQICFDNPTDKEGMYNIIDICNMVHENTVDVEWARKTLLALSEKIAEYEDLEITPDQVREMSRLYQQKCKEVARIESRLEKVIELPCNIGDIIFDTEFGGTILAQKVDGFSKGYLIEDEDEEDTYPGEVIIHCSGHGINQAFGVGEIGKTVFLAREEAEKSLNGRGDVE